MKRERQAPPQGYGSASDLPSFQEMRKQLHVFNLLSIFSRERNLEVISLKESLNALTDVVDNFYAQLGSRNWVFHDDMNPDHIRDQILIHPDPVDAERALVNLYKDRDWLELCLNQLRRLPGIELRFPLLQKAKLDYEAGRYYATTLVVLTIMDGFVNDLHIPKRGLHRRETKEMVAWDRVVGHHLGLSHAFMTYKKGIKKTKTEEVTDLLRNGIVHGIIVNYDNDIVATKSWNMLFAVGDWARSLEQQARPEPELPTFKEIINQIALNRTNNSILDAFTEVKLEQGEVGFLNHPAVKATEEFLSLWKAKNYGKMTRFLPKDFSSNSEVNPPLLIRRTFSDFHLRDYSSLRLSQDALAVAEVVIRVAINEQEHVAVLRWIRDIRTDEKLLAESGSTHWRLYNWNPQHMFQHIEESGDS